MSYHYILGNTVVGKALSKLKNDTDTGTRDYKSDYDDVHLGVRKFLIIRMMLFPNSSKYKNLN